VEVLVLVQLACGCGSVGGHWSLSLVGQLVSGVPVLVFQFTGTTGTWIVQYSTSTSTDCAVVLGCAVLWTMEEFCLADESVRG
jgi:hypothetical protein